MTERVIDLTKKSRRQGDAGYVQKIEWSALEYERRERSIGWYFAIGALGIGLIVISVLARNYLFIVLVILALAVIVLYTRKDPRRIAFVLTAEGVGINQQWMPLSDFTSFCVFDRPETRELSLETGKVMTPFLRLPLGSADAQKIKFLLATLLPEKEHPELLADHLARRLGF